MAERATCPACGAAPGEPCTTFIEGVDMGWDHDARILAPLLAELTRAEGVR